MAEAAKMNFKRELEAIQTIRDELKLKAHLAKADVKEELARLEDEWQRVEEEVRRTTAHAKEPLEAIGQKTKQLVAELKQGYEGLRREFVVGEQR